RPGRASASGRLLTFGGRMTSTTSGRLNPTEVITALIGAALVGVVFYLRTLEAEWYLPLSLIAAYIAVAFLLIRRQGFGSVPNPKDFYTGVLLLGVSGMFAAGLFEL